MRNGYAHFGRYIGNMLDQCIRAGITGMDAAALSRFIIKAGAGDYVEIGTWHGASAILAALTKRVYQIPGEIYCIDSFGVTHNSSAKEVMRNAKIFGVDNMIHITVANSHPWPLGDKTFSFGLIDGCHRGITPFRDFVNMSKRVTNYIMLDDVGLTHPHLAILCSQIQSKGEWRAVRITDKVMVFQRKIT